MTQHFGADLGSAKGLEGAGSGRLAAGAVKSRSADDAESAVAAALKGLSSIDTDGDRRKGLSSIDAIEEGDSGNRGDEGSS